MKINSNINDFIKAVTIGSQMAGKNSTLPILDYTKITFKNDRIIVSSFDMSTAITKVLLTQADPSITETSFLVNKKDFLSVLKTLSNESVEIDVTKVNVQIKHSNGVITLPTANVEEYPAPQVEKDVKNFSVKSNDLLYLFSEAVGFVGTDEIRPVMTGVRLLFGNNEITASATDAHVLFNNKIENETSEDTECIIPSSVVPILINTLKDTENVTVSVGTKNTVFKTEDSKVVVRSIEGRYPNVMAVIPKEHSTTIILDKQYFINSLNRTMVTASNATTMIKFNIYDNKMVIEAEDVDFAKSSKEEIKADIEGNDITIGFNGKKLMTCLGAVQSGNVVMELSAPNKAAILRDCDDVNKIVLVMPVMIQ